MVRDGPMLRTHEQDRGVGGVGQPASFDEAGTASIVHTWNRLGEAEMGSHLRRGVKEPGAQHLGRVLGVFLVTGEIISERQGLDGRADQARAQGVIGGFFARLGVYLAVLTHVREPVLGGRIRPVVRRDAHVVMLIAAGRDLRLLHHRRRDHGQGLVGVGDQFLQGLGDGFVGSGGGLRFFQGARTGSEERSGRFGRAERGRDEQEEEATDHGVVTLRPEIMPCKAMCLP